MPDCYVYDHVRTPRGRGKADGALHTVTALDLASHTLGAIRDRNSLDTSKVDDVVMGCVDPVGEAGVPSRIPQLISQFWQKTQRRLQWEKKIVPEPFHPRRQSSSPKWAKALLTTA